MHTCAAGAAWWEEGGSGTDAGGSCRGRLAVLGSAALFDDEWVGREDNTALLDFLLGWMLKDPACRLSAKRMAEPEVVDVRPVTHVAELAQRPRLCLQVGISQTGMPAWQADHPVPRMCAPSSPATSLPPHAATVAAGARRPAG